MGQGYLNFSKLDAQHSHFVGNQLHLFKMAFVAGIHSPEFVVVVDHRIILQFL